MVPTLKTRRFTNISENLIQIFTENRLLSFHLNFFWACVIFAEKNIECNNRYKHIFIFIHEITDSFKKIGEQNLKAKLLYY